MGLVSRYDYFGEVTWKTGDTAFPDILGVLGNGLIGPGNPVYVVYTVTTAHANNANNTYEIRFQASPNGTSNWADTFVLPLQRGSGVGEVFYTVIPPQQNNKYISATARGAGTTATGKGKLWFQPDAPTLPARLMTADGVLLEGVGGVGTHTVV